MSCIEEKTISLSTRDLVTFLSILVVILPWGMLITQSEVVIEGFLFVIVLRPVDSYVSMIGGIDSLSLIVVLIFLLPRIFFTYMLVRLYQGQTTMKRVVSVGVIVEFEIVFWAVLQGSNVFIISSWFYVMIGIPLPLLLLSVLYIMKRYPPESHDDSWLHDKLSEPVRPFDPDQDSNE